MSIFFGPPYKRFLDFDKETICLYQYYNIYSKINNSGRDYTLPEVFNYAALLAFYRFLYGKIL